MLFTKVKKRLFRFLRKTGILPQISYTLTQHDRNLQQRHISYQFCTTKHQKEYICKYIRSDTNRNNKAVFVVEFFNKKNIKIQCPDCGLSFNSKTGSYKYLKCGQHQIIFTKPAGIKTIKISLKPFGTQNANNIIIQSALISVRPKDTMLLSNYLSVECTKKDLHDFIKTYSFTGQDLYDCIQSTDNIMLAAHIAKLSLYIYPSKKMINLAKNLITQSGSIDQLYEIAKFAHANNLITDTYLEKCRVQSDLLHHRYRFYSECKDLDYTPNTNVLYLLHNSLPYNSGGYATRTHNLIAAINDSESEFHVSCLTRPGFPSDHQKHISAKLPRHIPPSDIIDSVKYLRSSQDSRYSYNFYQYIDQYTKDIIHYTKENKVGIIHAASNYPNGIAAINAARTLGIKSIYEVRGLWEITKVSRESWWENTENFQLQSQMETQACQEADVVITITKTLKSLMIKRGVDANKIHVVPNGVNCNKFIPLSKDQSIIQKYSLQGKTVIGYAGSIVEYEGLDYLLQACEVLRQCSIYNFKVIIVGDGNQLQRLEGMVKDLSLDEYVIFTGRVPHEDIPQYYSVFDIVPFPRKNSLVCNLVSPIKPFEAMAMQKAVIVSNCDALVEIVTDKCNGLVCEAENVQDLADKIKLLILNKELREHVAENALEYVRNERDWKKICKTVINIYDGLIKEINS